VYESLLALARELADADSDAVQPFRLRRATSTAYYALFHAISAEAADRLAGAGAPEWGRVHRALEHRQCRDECARIAKEGAMGSGIRECAGHFTTLYDARQRADYDPVWQVTPALASAQVAGATAAISGLLDSPENERRAFVVRVLFKTRT